MYKEEVAVSRGYTILKCGKVLNKFGKVVSGVSREGYLQFKLTVEGKDKFVKFHRLQAFMKFGNALFEEGVVVRHLDNNKRNNDWKNISIGSHRENIMDNLPRDRRLWASSPKHDHEAIIKDYYSGYSYNTLMEKYNISSKGTISFIIRKSLKSEET